MTPTLSLAGFQVSVIVDCVRAPTVRPCGTLGGVVSGVAVGVGVGVGHAVVLVVTVERVDSLPAASIAATPSV